MSTFLIYIFAIIFYCFFYRYLNKKLETFIEKSIFAIISIVYFTPFILYIFDRFNLPTIFFPDVDTARWFNFISSYLSAIMGTVIGSAATFIVLYFQIKYQREEAKEERRIHNLPLFVYEFSKSISDKLSSVYTDVYINYEPKNMNNLYFKVENIGLNHSKKVFYIVEIEEIRYSSYFDASLSVLRAGYSFGLNLIFGLGRGSHKEFKVSIKILFKDLLENCYCQNIVLQCLNNSSENKQKLVDINNYVIDDAIIISQDEWDSFTKS